MSFNSSIFVLFFAVVYSAYLLLGKRFKTQNILLLVASYVFYGYWDWRFLGLLLFSTVLDFGLSHWIDRTADPGKRKSLLVFSVVANLGILGFFKYFNFFADSFATLLATVGLEATPLDLRIILPVGISFYTFQSMSYTVDVYRRELKAERSLVNFALYVAFFPQLVAGPIERAASLLETIARPRTIPIDKVNAGLYLIVWGYFKKLVVGDNLGTIANEVFNHYHDYSGLDLVLGVVAFSFQIYCDFSGYSDIARGLAKLMGFELMVNFRLPYFATSPSDFWARWHISLSTWLRDYLYIPLGGNRHGSWRTSRNLMITMALGGLWHGAAWTFVIWGIYHGSLLILYRQLGSHFARRLGAARTTALLVQGVKMLVMFCFTLIGWAIFRAQSVEQLVYFARHAGLAWSPDSMELLTTVAFFVAPLLLFEAWQQWSRDLFALLHLRPVAQALAYSSLVVGLSIFAAREVTEFIYFQF
ncbi:MAG: MBOAT family O-acyltransferase [Planctomycetota bacterium]